VLTTREVPGLLSAASDDVAGARLATEHLLGLGHRRLTFLANPPGDGYRGRRRGYEDAMAEAGLPAHVRETSYDAAEVRRDARDLLADEQRPTAVFAHNDRAAVAVLGALADLGLRCPEDVSVVGYDGAEAASLPGIELTTVDSRAAEVGRQAARIALAQVDDGAEAPKAAPITPRLITRRTTAAPTGA
jgi:DNA-binding LacI/PurR family transcriptional regulator